MIDRIYHIEIPEELCSNDDIEHYLRVEYNLKPDVIGYMTSDKELTIEELIL